MARDPVVIELVDYFDKSSKFQNIRLQHKPELLQQWRFKQLTDEEIKVIEMEYYKCAKDFRYAATNYFYIVHKNSLDNIFSLWESQELILEKVNYMRKIGLPAKLMVLKARQLGCSLLIESMIAWRAMFSKNINALVVSYDQEHAEYLYGLMQHIYDRMPWWLKPRIASRKMDTGLWFDNPDPAMRSADPGLNSRVYVEWANKMSGVGMGKRLNAAHISEYSEFKHLKKIVEQDMTHAFATDDPNFFAILESTAKGTGHYSYKLWRSNVELAEKAEWLPVFLPWFFESSRRWINLPEDWKADKEDLQLRSRAAMDWVRCDNAKCHQFQERYFLKKDRTLETCTLCHEGKLQAYEIDDHQLAWMNNHRRNAKMKEEDSLRKLKQEMASSAEEAFQSSGIQIFSSQVLDFVGTTLKKNFLYGMFDRHGLMHAMLPVPGDEKPICVCEGCKSDHAGDEMTWRIWEPPKPGANYVVGVDVAEGLELDDSVIFINKVGRRGSGMPDEQVASLVSNKINPIDLAKESVKGAKFYNTAILAIERNMYSTCNSDATTHLNYPNMYKPRHITKSGTSDFRATGWQTTPMTKPWLTHQARRWLKAELWKLRDPMLLEELKTFQKDDEETKGTGASDGNKDDYVMAAMIALFASHELDWEENQGLTPLRNDLTLENAPYVMTCSRCNHRWPLDQPTSLDRCPQCNCMFISGQRNAILLTPQTSPALGLPYRADPIEEKESDNDYSIL